jgi:hypothetical protein
MHAVIVKDSPWGLMIAGDYSHVMHANLGVRAGRAVGGYSLLQRRRAAQCRRALGLYRQSGHIDT